jgi:hypothetical protein
MSRIESSVGIGRDNAGGCMAALQCVCVLLLLLLLLLPLLLLWAAADSSAASARADAHAHLAAYARIGRVGGSARAEEGGPEGVGGGILHPGV